MEDPEVRRRVSDLLQAGGVALIGLVLLVLAGNNDVDVLGLLGGLCLLAAIAWAVVALFALARRVREPRQP
jgi:drug/metabolite transporter (DMT)-like permease